HRTSDERNAVAQETAPDDLELVSRVALFVFGADDVALDRYLVNRILPWHRLDAGRWLADVSHNGSVDRPRPASGPRGDCPTSASRSASAKTCPRGRYPGWSGHAET